jgi:hypothetical protein
VGLGVLRMERGEEGQDQSSSSVVIGTFISSCPQLLSALLLLLVPRPVPLLLCLGAARVSRSLHFADFAVTSEAPAFSRVPQTKIEVGLNWLSSV